MRTQLDKMTQKNAELDRLMASQRDRIASVDNLQREHELKVLALKTAADQIAAEKVSFDLLVLVLNFKVLNHSL